MKNTIKCIGIIVIVTVIGFLALPLTACSGGGDGGGGGIAPTVTTESLPDGIVGTEYSQTLMATGTTPITWSIFSGTLPEGLSLAPATGAISGTPTEAGTSNFRVMATNATGNRTKALSIVIGETPIPLTLDTWADGNIPTSSDVQWFSFTATASTQYIHVDFGTLTDLYVQVYDSSGTEVGSETYLSVYAKYTSLSVTSEQTYYIKVTSGTFSGTYKIGFTTSTTAPSVTLPTVGITPLTLDTWADGNIPTSDDVQWFSFTATASSQYIHVSLGTLRDLYVQVYDSSGTTVGSETELTSNSTNKYISRSVTSGQTYYIKVRPYNTNTSIFSGTYKIGFNTSMVPPGTIPLTLDTWADGNCPTSSAQWFSFTATASSQYIHVSLGTLRDLYVQVYDSSGTTVGTETELYSSSTNKYISRPVTSEQTYYIRVRPYGSSNSGTYKIGFTTSMAPPGTIPLTLNTWADGNIPTRDDVQWFSFTATAASQYIHVSFGTQTLAYVQVYNSSGTTVGTETTLSNSGNKYTLQSVTLGQTYYIRVRPGSVNSGTYKIGFNTSIVPPSTIPLTLDTWANGNLVSAQDVQWFSFTATASSQYIHVDFGTLTGVSVQVYDSSVTTVGSETLLSNSGNNYTSRSVTSGQTYYITVKTAYGNGSSSGSSSGTYKIGFTTSTTAPTS